MAPPNNSRKISPNFGGANGAGGVKSNNMKTIINKEEPDPGQLLNEWLGELDNLQKVK